MHCDSFKIMFTLGILIFYVTPAALAAWFVFKTARPRQFLFEVAAGVVLISAAIAMFVYCQ